MEKQAFEQSGLIPRSIIRTFDRFRRQLLPGSEQIVIQEFRISRYQVLVSVKSLLTLIFIPLILNFLLKSFLLTPLTEFCWNTYQTDIFLNSYQQERALEEIHNFEEKLFFESLVEEPISRDSDNQELMYPLLDQIGKKSQSFYSHGDLLERGEVTDFRTFFYSTPLVFENDSVLKKQFQQKTIEIAFQYNEESILAITNLFGDFVTFLTILLLFILMKPQIIILKSFLTESIYSLSDTTKSFLLIFFTDLLVGFHSPRGWDLVLEIFLKHFGLPENKDFILLFVATFPVLLDTVFKYWIFRYLNKISPSTVATYHNMIE
jgi:hypothetical protein